MPRIDTIRLRCRDPKAQEAFYQEILGMGLREDGTLGFGPCEAGLKFEQVDAGYQPSSGDIYWKIALAVPNIELAYKQLIDQGIEVGVPRQFQQVGYLAHFQDPEGFAVELIEHYFKGNRPEGQHDRSLLGGGAVLSLLTLRCHDITPLRTDILDWGMTPLSIQPVTSHGFTLHFFAFTDDTPPNPDLTAIENREWLYQRPYTILEIQEVHGADAMAPTAANQAGYAETEFTQMFQTMQSKDLAITGKKL